MTFLIPVRLALIGGICLSGLVFFCEYCITDPKVESRLIPHLKVDTSVVTVYDTAKSYNVTAGIG